MVSWPLLAKMAVPWSLQRFAGRKRGKRELQASIFPTSSAFDHATTAWHDPSELHITRVNAANSAWLKHGLGEQGPFNPKLNSAATGFITFSCLLSSDFTTSFSNPSIFITKLCKPTLGCASVFICTGWPTRRWPTPKRGAGLLSKLGKLRRRCRDLSGIASWPLLQLVGLAALFGSSFERWLPRSSWFAV